MLFSEASYTEWMIVYGKPLQDVPTHKGSREECGKGVSPEICTETDELDHISLKERYRILLGDKSSGPATVETGRPSPKR